MMNDQIIVPLFPEPQKVLKQFILGGGFGREDTKRVAHGDFSRISRARRPIDEWTKPGDAIGIWALICLELGEPLPKKLAELQARVPVQRQHWLGRLAFCLLAAVDALSHDHFPTCDWSTVFSIAAREWDARNRDGSFITHGTLRLDYRLLVSQSERDRTSAVANPTSELNRTVALLRELGDIGVDEVNFILGITGIDEDRLVVAADNGYTNAALHLAFCEYANQPEEAVACLRQATMALVRERIPDDDANAQWIELAQYQLELLESQQLNSRTWDAFEDAFADQAISRLSKYRWSELGGATNDVKDQCRTVLRCEWRVRETQSAKKEHWAALVQQASNLIEVVCKYLLKEWPIKREELAEYVEDIENWDQRTTPDWWIRQALDVPGVGTEELEKIAGVKLRDIHRVLHYEGRTLMSAAEQLPLLIGAILLTSKRWKKHPFRVIHGDLNILKLFETYRTRSKRNVAHWASKGLTKLEALERCEFVLDWTDRVMMAAGKGPGFELAIFGA